MKEPHYVKIGSLCQMVKGTSPTLRTPPGSFPLVVTAEFRRSSDTWQLEGPAVCVPLISSTGHGDAALHRVHYQEGKFALANLLVALLPNDPAVLCAKYLYHLLMTRKDQLLVPLMLGTANVSLKEKDIAEVEIPLPPLAEQRGVVARIEELAAQIHEARTLRRQAAEEAEALVGAYSLALFSSLGRSASVGDVCEVIDPNPSHRYPQYVDDGIPIVSSSDFVGDDGINPALAKRVPQEFYEATLGRFSVGEGDVVFSRKGKVGYARLHPRGMRLAMTHTLCVLKPDRARVDPRYLLHFARSPMFLEELAGTMNPNVGVPTLGLGVIRDASFPDLPLPDQRRIVAELDALQAEVGALKRLQGETSAELDALLPAVLDRAFKGELIPREQIEIPSTKRAPVKVLTTQHSRPFIRAVFAADIVTRLHRERTFGQVKFQKALFLAEYAAQVLEIESRPRRHQNGPHDPELIREVEAEMRAHGWFESYSRSDGSPGHAYRPLASAGEHTSYFERFWPDKAPLIRRVIDTLLKWDTERCERLATVYAAWNDLLIWNRPVTDAAILSEILVRWHPAKLNIPKAKWQETIAWVRENGFVPAGFGAATGEAPQSELF